MHILKDKRVLIALAGVLVVAIVAVVVMSLSPSVSEVQAGQTVIVTVTAGAVDDMYGYQFQINYNADELEYTGGLVSKISSIEWIFAKPFDGYELVGATMTGDRTGISGKNEAVCEMRFVAKKDCVISEETLSLSKVNVVQSDLVYLEDIPDWKYKATLA